MRLVEKFLFFGIFTILLGLSLWLQYGIIESEPAAIAKQNSHDPDYYIENFTAIGMDKKGRRKYILEAERLVHYPDDGTALLDNPHVIQYETGKPPVHTYSESGWVSSNAEEVLLTGNVRMIQGKGAGQAGGVMTSEKMTINLKKGRKNLKKGKKS